MGYHLSSNISHDIYLCHIIYGHYIFNDILYAKLKILLCIINFFVLKKKGVNPLYCYLIQT